MIRPFGRRSSVGVAVAALALGLAPGVCQATSIPGPNGKIVFASGRASSGIPAPAANDSDARIWVADYRGGTPVQVTTLPAGTQHRHPNWSPDHTRIVYAAGAAFSGEYALWIVDLRTGSQTEFVPKASTQDRPTWSPDGKEIAYGSNGDLWMKEVEGEHKVTRLTETVGITEERPVWSPDGKTIYYNRKVGAGDRDVYRKSPVTLAGAEEAVVSGATEDWQPAVSPNGNKLCFLRGPQNSGADLYTVNVNGTNVTEFSTTAAVGDLNCVWSPDGTRILYTLGAFEAGDLITKDINGNNPDVLTNMNVASHFDGNADWATNFPPDCDDESAQVPVNGFVGIELRCVDPDHGFGAEPPTPEQLESGALEIVGQPSHGNIGGISQGKVIYTPAKDFKGTDSFTYTGSDEVSEGAPAKVTVTVGSEDRTAPTISAVKMSSRRWRRGGKLASVSRTRVGTTISFRLSEAARATLSFKRVKRNGKTGKTAGSLSVDAHAGASRVRFQGRLSKSRRLRPGRYRLVVGAQDAAGNRAKPKNGPAFTIVAG